MRKLLWNHCKLGFLTIYKFREQNNTFPQYPYQYFSIRSGSYYLYFNIYRSFSRLLHMVEDTLSDYLKH